MATSDGVRGSFLLLGGIQVGLGVACLVAGVWLYRRDGWSVSDTGVSPSPRAVGLGETAIAAAVLATGAFGVVAGGSTVLPVSRSNTVVRRLFEVGQVVLRDAIVVLVLAAMAVFLGGLGWRIVSDRDN